MTTTIRIAGLCSTDVSSRSNASDLRRKIIALVQAGSNVELDLGDVRTISDSFADELFGVLARDKGSDWFRQWIQIKNAEEFPRATILDEIKNRLQLT